MAVTRELCRFKPALVDSQSANLRVESLPRNSKLRGRAGRARDPSPGFGQGSFDYSFFLIRVQTTEGAGRHAQRRLSGQFAF